MGNPFELFGEEGKKKKEPPQEKKTPPSSRRPEGPPPSDSEVAEMMERMNEIHEQIRTTVSEAFGQRGFSSEDLSTFLKDPKHFTDEQWTLIREEQNKWEEKLWVQLGTEKKMKTKQRMEKKKGAKRKGKTIGARKKWLEMR